VVPLCRPEDWDAETMTFDELKQIYDLAYDMGLKGCTAFCPNPVTGNVLSEQTGDVDASHCYVIAREAD
jgi:ribonucleoside-diphosphate reductase alpha chain